MGAVTCDTAAMACGPRWMRAVWAREGVCECLEFMPALCGSDMTIYPHRGRKAIRNGGLRTGAATGSGDRGAANRTESLGSCRYRCYRCYADRGYAGRRPPLSVLRSRSVSHGLDDHSLG